jgi:chemotaxis protein methyltransferase CheR
MPPAASHNIDNYEPLLVALQNVLGVVVPDELRGNLLERIEPLLSNYKLDSLAALAESLQSTRADELHADLLVNVLDIISQQPTAWSLNAEIKNLLHNYVFAQLPENARLWIVGCGQGQLAYSVAMEAAEYEHKSGEVKNLQFIATDVSHSDIKVAELATYSAQQLTGLSEEYKKLYTTLNNKGDSWQIKDKIRQLINFRQCDLTEDFQSLGKMDVIICPEVLVYYSNGVKAGIIQQFSELLKSGGIFLTGNNQMIIPHATTSQDHGLERVEHPAGVFYRQKY